MTTHYSIRQRAFAEALGTGLLATAVIGSGVMAERLAGGNVASALLCNAIATAAALFVLIETLAPVSGAHFNPAITILFVAEGLMPLRGAAIYAGAQIAGGLAGAIIAHLMFELPAIQIGVAQRFGVGQWFGEIIATAGLTFVIWRGRSISAGRLPALIGLYIGAAYWFTSSTSFANPAVTVARMLTSTFAGIRPQDAAFFVAMQLVGAGIGRLAARAFDAVETVASGGADR